MSRSFSDLTPIVSVLYLNAMHAMFQLETYLCCFLNRTLLSHPFTLAVPSLCPSVVSLPPCPTPLCIYLFNLVWCCYIHEAFHSRSRSLSCLPVKLSKTVLPFIPHFKCLSPRARCSSRYWILSSLQTHIFHIFVSVFHVVTIRHH